nr:hypothetical protein CFP56_67901 [Quercus suber]
MGKKRRLPLVHVGEGPSCSRQRGEENLEAAYTTPQARADARDAGTTPPGWWGESVQEELRAALAADQAIGDASDDDETQPPSPCS